MLIENSTLEEVNKEAYKMSEFLNQIPEVAIRVHAKCIMSKVRNNILKEMNLEAHEVKKYDTEMKEIKNTDGDTVVKVNEDGIVVAGVLKTNKEQDQEMGVINYLPVESIKCNLAPEFIKQVTEEVIKKMKEDHISFGKIQLPSEQIPIDVNKDTSNVDNKTSNAEDIEVNKERDSEAFSITVNIETPEIIQEIVNTYIESLKVMSKAMKEFEEKANCKIEVLKGKVNSLKIENNKLKEGLKCQKGVIKII